MVYIKLESDEEYINNKSFFSKIFSILKNKIYKIRVELIDNKKMIIINNLEENTLKKLSKYIQVNSVTRVCLSDNLFYNDFFKSYIINQNVKICDGRWLFKYLTKKCVNYICFCKKEKIQNQKISILSNDIDKTVYYIINEMAKEVKAINVISKNEKKFRKLEKELYSEYGIVLNMNNNYKRSLLKSDIIINLDFTNDEVNRYIIDDNTCLINMSSKNIEINSKTFNGIIINSYEISFPNKYIKSLIFFKGFNIQVLYESFIYKNTSPNNIKKELYDDNINIVSLIGKYDKIRKSEFYKTEKEVKNK